MKKIILIIGVFFFLIACRKDIIEVDENYEGDWYTIPDTSIQTYPYEYTSLKINSQNELYYEVNRDYKTIEEFSGSAEIKQNTIYVERYYFGYRYFVIISPPIQIDSFPYHWRMKLSRSYVVKTYYRE